MEKRKLQEILDKIKNVRAAVYGDFCLDAYWILDPKGGEISVETSLQAEAVKKQYYTLGGASNVVANLAALEPGHISATGAIGDDIFGRELVSQMQSLDVDTSGMVIQYENFDTMVFAKRYIDDVEQPRIDFGYLNRRSRQTDDAIIENIEAALETCDVMIFNQQVPGSISDYFIEKANEVFDRYKDKIILLDTRYHGSRFSNIYRKANDIEAAGLNGVVLESTDAISLEEIETYAANLFAQSQKPVFITCGRKGILSVDKSGVVMSPGIKVSGKIDTVGAGDTALGAIGLALAGGFNPSDAAEFANLAAAVTVRKLFTTGTANAREILELNNSL